jgi:hypothetical protein
MGMRICYLDCHEAGLCCYLVIHIENLLRPWQLCYFHFWSIYWLSLVCWDQWTFRQEHHHIWHAPRTQVYTPSHRTNWRSSNAVSFLFRRCSVLISAGILAIPVGIFVDFLGISQANVGRVPSFACYRFLPNTLQFIVHHSSSHSTLLFPDANSVLK